MSVRDREEAVVTRLHALAPHLDGEPDPAFRAATRARLVAMAAVRTPAPEPVSPWKRLFTRTEDAAPALWRSRLTAGLAGAAMAVTALATLVAVAADAGPGDPLYGLKRGTEQTQLALAGDARGEKLLDLARTRLDEVRTLVDSGATALPAAGTPAPGSAVTVLAAGADPALVVQTLDTMDEQTTEGAAWLAERAVTTEDAAPLGVLAGWATEQADGLAELRDDVPAEAEDDVTASLALLSDIATRASGLDASLDCAGGPATTGTDALGPVPSLCLPAQPVVPGPGAGTTGTDPPVPGAGTTPPTEVPDPSAPPVIGTLPEVPGAPGEPGGGGLPTSVVPPLPTGVVPTSPLPLPSISVTIPPLLPGSSAQSSAPTTTPRVTLDVCLGPVALGDC